ncbi:AhpD family alkylhydroperoxidase [Dokdonella fugitiva]|uniref:AhpD family alkylhydroperoxidase n=1 Tax=Dokdonella fugitiva TaxID=328517 RepID=A0A839FAA4_9GAMM|nr:carboxymuconolactone decarboxylase family protein [Dokdonella fugitiva]MBA8889044.1 AhpD family alkylhydroperoxidase [Dokdonella fugitiva]
MKTKLSIAILSLVVAGASAGAGEPATQGAQDAKAEMRRMFGRVPGFVEAFPDAGIAGAWDEFKAVQLSGDSALSPKVKELIGLAVAAQIPCQYCVYFHAKSAKADGASDEEIKEAVAMAAVTRHWSTVINGAQVDFATFRDEVDAMMRYASEHAKQEAKATGK